MDKNTRIGLILMALIFLVFMWLAPKPETDQTADTEAEMTEQVAASALGRDSLSPSEQEWLLKNLTEYGSPVTLPDGRQGRKVSTPDLELTVAGDSVFGTVSVAGKTLPWDKVLANDESLMTPDQQRDAVRLVRESSNAMGRYGRFASFLKGSDKEIVLANDVINLTFSAKGGTVSKARLLKYDTEYSSDETKNEKNPVIVFDKNTDRLSFLLPQDVATADLYFRPEPVNDSTLRMVLDLADDAYWGIEYSLPKGDSYLLSMKVIQKNMAPVIRTNARTIALDWSQKIKRQEKGRMFEERNSGLYYKFAGGSVENLSESKSDKEERQAKIRWIGFKNQFFSSVIIADRPFNTADFSSTVLKGSDYLKDVKAEAEINDYDWNNPNPASFSFFIGPNLYPMLSALDKSADAGEDLNLTRLIPLGWTLFRWINVGIIIPVFNFLGSFISNYGIIILLLTIFIKIILFPLTYKSYLSQAKMRILAPDIKALNEKDPGNENMALRQQKTMALYSQAGANPMSGCLPMLLQMPILFAMFTFFPSCIELRGQSFLWAHDLSAPDAIISWSGNIPLVTEYFGNHISLFCLLMTIVNIIYTRINMANSPGQVGPMKWMMYLMPVFFMIFFNNYAAGLSYYYFLSLLITILQTYAFRFFVNEESVRKTMAENAKKPKKKSGFMARLEEAQRQQQQMLREQQKKQGRR